MILSRDILTLTIDGELSIYHDNDSAKRYGDPSQQYVFDPDAIVGWDDTPDIKRTATERPMAHGDFASRGFYGARLVTITGHALADGPRTLYMMRDRLVSYLQDGQEHEITVLKGEELRSMKISQGSSLSWVQMFDHYAKWKVDLYAADPRMYGRPKFAQSKSQTSENLALEYPITYPLDFGSDEEVSTTTITNDGNSPSWPIYTVDTYLPNGFSIINGANKITFGGAVTGGAPVIIDTFKGTATVDGFDRTYQLIQRDWTPIPPYGSLTVDFKPLGGQESAAWADITWRDTWL